MIEQSEHDSLLSFELQVFIYIFALLILLVALILLSLRYRKKRTINSLILIFIMFFGIFGSISNLIIINTERRDSIQPYIGISSIFGMLCILIILNKRLEKKVEERTLQLKKSEENYRTLVNNLSDIVFELNTKLVITYVSPQVKNLLNYEPKDLINQKISNFIHLDDKESTINNFKKIFNSKKEIAAECRFKTISNNFIDTSIKGSYVKKDNTNKIVGIIRDISEQKIAEQMINEQIEKLKEIDQIRSDIVRRTSHELKTPLISIFSSTQHLLNEYKGEMSKNILKFIKVINRGGKRLKLLINNFVDAYKIESNGLKLNKSRIDLIKTLKNCANDMIFSLKERDLYLKVELTGEFYIEVDEIRIEQVIFNIISNAIKNTPSKGIILITLKKSENYVDIIVRDTGAGFTEVEKKEIFKKFGKIERRGIKKDLDTEGSGLGLFISKEIIEMHGGTIILESEGRNQGSSFIIRIPMETAAIV